MSKKPQTFANHGRFDPLFHFILVPVFIGCFIESIVFLFHGINALHIWLAIFSLAVVLLCTMCRNYALKVQDRVIRLEERLRLSALLPEALKARIPELTERQLIALRFASDAEVPSLVGKTLKRKISTEGHQASYPDLAAGLLAGLMQR